MLCFQPAVYQRSSSASSSFRSWRTTSLHLRRGPLAWRVLGSPPNSVLLCKRASDFLAKWPSHSIRLLATFMATVSRFPTAQELMQMLIASTTAGAPRMVRMQRWWKALSRSRCLRSGVQQPDAYIRTDKTRAWYTCRLAFVVRFLSVNTARRRAPNALEAWALCLSIFRCHSCHWSKQGN